MLLPSFRTNPCFVYFWEKNKIKMDFFVVLSAVLALAVVVPSVSSVENSSIFLRMIANCMASNDTATCFSIKGIMALNRAARIGKIEILPGVTIRRYGCGFLYYW